jgi:ABC-2 type transport system ATP-binding protein
MSEEIAIKVEGVSKNFVLPHEKHTSLKSKTVHAFKRTKGSHTQHALKDISFEIKKGEFLGIVGRNGSGKSTLLKMLAGIYQPTKGKISVSGKLVPFIELGVGFNPELTGRENVFLNGALLGFSNDEVAKMYDEVVEFAELERFMDQKLKNYSSGMQVRLAFSMAVRANADILLIDEVLAVGDADFQRKCYDYFRKLKKDKKTVVFVSHDMDAVKEYCDRALLIEDSCVTKEGNPHKIATYYKRLFTDELKRYGISGIKDANRWGDKTMQYSKVVAVPDEISKKHPEVVIKTTIKAHADVKDPVFGFTIKNQVGEHLIGTNTAIEGKAQLPISKGEERELVWSIPNIFTDGTYFVNISAEYLNGRVQSDWVEDATTFKVKKESRKSYYKVSPEVQFSSNKKVAKQ